MQSIAENKCASIQRVFIILLIFATTPHKQTRTYSKQDEIQNSRAKQRKRVSERVNTIHAQYKSIPTDSL